MSLPKARCYEAQKRPAARSAATALLNFTQTLIGTKPFDRQRCLVATGPIAFTLAVAMDQQLANSMPI